MPAATKGIDTGLGMHNAILLIRTFWTVLSNIHTDKYQTNMSMFKELLSTHIYITEHIQSVFSLLWLQGWNKRKMFWQKSQVWIKVFRSKCKLNRCSPYQNPEVQTQHRSEHLSSLGQKFLKKLKKDTYFVGSPLILSAKIAAFRDRP